MNWMGITALFVLVVLGFWAIGRARGHDAPKEPNYGGATYFGRVPEVEKTSASDGDDSPVRVIIAQTDEVRALQQRFGVTRKG